MYGTGAGEQAVPLSHEMSPGYTPARPEGRGAMQTVIFDLDGTLADTSADLIAAANACFRDMGHGDQLDADRDARTAFQGGRAMLRLGFERVSGRAADESDVDAQYLRLLSAYEGAIDVHTRLYPGAVAAVEALLSRGVAVGICTNKPAGLAETLLRRLGVRELFASMIGADTLPVKKPDPAPFVAAVTQAGGDVARSCLVGDTETDLLTARAAGVPAILVGFGPAGDAVAGMGADAVLAAYGDLDGVLGRLWPAPA